MTTWNAYLTAIFLVVLSGLASPAASAEPVQEPGSWSCGASELGLDRVAVGLAPVDPVEREIDGNAIEPVATQLGTWVPILLVHGWTSRATHPTSDGTDDTRGAFSHPIDLTANRAGSANVGRSLVGQLQGIPGAAVFTFDYHPYSGRWVTDEHLGPALAKVSRCLQEASGQPVILVGHSMGGLLSRFAASDPVARGSIGRVITLGTPTEGSLAALVAIVAADSAAAGEALAGRIGPLVVLRLLLAGCGEISSDEMDAQGLCSFLPAFVRAFDGDAGRALRQGSRELASLNARSLPDDIPFNAIAGSAQFELPSLGWFSLPAREEYVSGTDVVVLEESAIARATATQNVRCRYQMDATRGAVDTLGLTLRVTAPNEAAEVPWSSLSGACFHNNLMRSIELTNEVMGLIDEDIRERDEAALAARCSITAFEEEDPPSESVTGPQVIACDGRWAVYDPGDGATRSIRQWDGTRWVWAYDLPTSLCRDEFVDLGATETVADAVEWSCESLSAGTWPTSRNDGGARLMLWLGASAAWPDAPDIEYPQWIACDDSGRWCLLGGTEQHTMIDTQGQITVVGRIAQIRPNPAYRWRPTDSPRVKWTKSSDPNRRSEPARTRPVTQEAEGTIADPASNGLRRSR